MSQSEDEHEAGAKLMLFFLKRQGKHSFKVVDIPKNQFPSLMQFHKSAWCVIQRLDHMVIKCNVAPLLLCVLLPVKVKDDAGHRLSVLGGLIRATLVLPSHRSLRIWCGLLLHLPEVVIWN